MNSDRNARLKRVVTQIRSINIFMHYAAGFGLVVMLGLTVADIGGREFFSNPIPGTVEVTALVLVVVVFLGLAHSEDNGDHITVDLIYERVGKKTRRVLDVFANVLSVLVLGLMAYRLYQFGFRQRTSGAETPVLEWAVWPFVFVAALGSLLYAVATLLKILLRARGEPADAVEEGAVGSGVEI